MDVAVNVALVLLFVLVGGFFAGAEIALVSLRDSQVTTIAEHSGRGRRVARMHAEPNRFLSAVQIGVTFAGFFASSFGATTIAVQLEPVITGWGVPAGVASLVALVAVTALVSYLSIVLGELVPKRLALQNPARASLVVAGVLDRFASLTRPLIWLLSRSTNAVVRLLGLDPQSRQDEVGEDELRDMVRSSNALTPDEQRLLSGAFEATDRVVGEVMVPRTEVDFVGSDVTVADAVGLIEARPHSRYPVAGPTPDDVVGVVHVRDLLPVLRSGSAAESTVGELARPVRAIPRGNRVLDVLAEMRRRGSGHLAVVVDEYGGTDGIVTLEDLVEEVVGQIRDEYDPSPVPARPAPGGGVDADGLLRVDDVEHQTGIVLPAGPYNTLAGYVVHELGHVPVVGDAVVADGHRLTVQATDGFRASTIRVVPLAPGESADGQAPDG